jgi:hypothetical protein
MNLEYNTVGAADGSKALPTMAVGSAVSASVLISVESGVWDGGGADGEARRGLKMSTAMAPNMSMMSKKMHLRLPAFFWYLLSHEVSPKFKPSPIPK